MLAGGLVTSLGLTWLASRPSARARLGTLRGATVFVVAALALAAGAGAVVWLVGALLESARAGNPVLPSTPGLLLFGVFLGLPLALPAVVMSWSDARRRRAAELNKRDFVPTKDDRRAFAEKLEKQIVELSHEPRSVKASIGGDGGRILSFEGDLDAGEGSRLVSALRADLKELDFKRVEGGSGASSWWEPV